jgi:hypothetical protein
MVVLYTVLACAALVALVPLYVWGATGNWRHAVHALREYGKAMAVPIGIGLVFAAAALITYL